MKKPKAKGKNEDNAFLYWERLPALDRIEKWYELTHAWPIGVSFEVLGRALRDWAREQKAKP